MQFARDMECLVIAEGIERQEEAEVLYRHAVTKVQGYYYAKPAPLHQGGSNLLHMNEIKEKIRQDALLSSKLA
jgi:EAL domain-containing protein (putative c-di-GMP-specific phosphodiesterase class I)